MTAAEAAEEDRRLIDSAKSGKSKKLLAEAIARRCIECAYDPLEEGSGLDQVAKCEARTCPLYGVRPRTNGQAVEWVSSNDADSAELRYKDKLIRKAQQAGTERDAINGYCIDCQFDAHEPGTWREQVRECASRTCDLFLVRAK